MKNRDGFAVDLTKIKKISEYDDGYTIVIEKYNLSVFLGKRECDGFVPQEDDWILLTTHQFSKVVGIIIEGHVIRNKSMADVNEDFEQFKKDLRLKRLERYIEHGDELKARVEKLHPALRDRMNRFGDERGESFWIDDAPYEMIVLEGANALLDKVNQLYDHSVDKIEWLKWWWSLNTAEHNYDYARQMTLVPDFGQGHSGNTAAAAYGLAVAILNNKEV